MKGNERLFSKGNALMIDPFRGHWKGKPAILIAGGQSALPWFFWIKKRNHMALTIGVNLAGLKLLWPRICVIFDPGFVKDSAAIVQAFNGIVFFPSFHMEAINNYPRNVPRFHPVELLPGGVGLTNDHKAGIFANGGGAGLAISVAWALGCDPICLVGYDYNANFLDHWYPGDRTARSLEKSRLQIEKLAERSAGRIINCSFRSWLKGFEVKRLNEVVK